MTQGNSQVAAKMQEVASGLKSSQGGTGDSNSSDYKCNAATKQGSGPDLSGHASGGK